MGWPELVFMLVVLKLPVVYLCCVVWWAIKAEPRPEEGAATRVALDPTRRALVAPARRTPPPAARRPAARPLARPGPQRPRRRRTSAGP